MADWIIWVISDLLSPHLEAFTLIFGLTGSILSISPFFYHWS